jgi:hypothetical protein
MGNRDQRKQHFAGQRIGVEFVGNPSMVKNIRESKTTLELATNAGMKTTKQVADIPGFGTVWYDETAIANIFGLYRI